MGGVTISHLVNKIGIVVDGGIIYNYDHSVAEFLVHVVHCKPPSQPEIADAARPCSPGVPSTV